MSEPSAWAKAQAAEIITACPAGHDRYPSCAECVRVALDAAWWAGAAATVKRLRRRVGRGERIPMALFGGPLPAPGEER